MITDHDRSYYIGASDTKYVMGNWNTQTFRHWWDVKMGFTEDDFDNIYLRTGTMYEHKILDYLNCDTRDRQIIIGRLRVNLDGEFSNTVAEIKTYRMKEGWKPPKAYIDQVQVELFATNYESGHIFSYGLLDEEYEAVEHGIVMPIQKERLSVFPVDRNDKWLDEEYLPRLWYLCRCLEEERLPCMDEL